MRRGGRKRPVAKGCPYGKPKTSGAVKEQKPERNLQSIAEETMEGRWERHVAMRDRTLEWASGLADRGLSILAAEGARSPTVTCIGLPSEGDGPRIVKEMSERGWVIGGGYGRLKPDAFRIGHMGDHTVDELEPLLAELEEVLK